MIPSCTRLQLCFNNYSNSQPNSETVNEEIKRESDLDGEGDPELPDRILHPEQYDGEMMNYASIEHGGIPS